MIKEKESSYEEQVKEVQMVCPVCSNTNKISIPIKVVIQSKQLTTVSVPSGLVCEHTFQAFVDKNFKVRGYQKVDYELSKMEILAGSGDTSEPIEGKQSSLSSLPLFQDVINLLRRNVDDREVLGSGLFTIDGKVLYSSLPHNTLSNTIREFEVRETNQLIRIQKMLLELENDQKVCSQYMEIYGTKFILVLVFSPIVRMGMGILLLNKLVQKIMEFI